MEKAGAGGGGAGFVSGSGSGRISGAVAQLTITKAAKKDTHPTKITLFRIYSHLHSKFIETHILHFYKERGHKDLTKIQDSIKEGWIRELSLRTKGEKALYETLSVSLGLGEASSIAIAKTREFRFASDDKTARREAQHLNIRVTGTLGILKKAVLSNHVEPEKGDIILAKMTAQGFYSPISSLGEIKT